MKFWKRYSLFLALPCPRVPESLRKRVVVDLQLGDLQQKKNNLPKYIDFHFQRNINCYNEKNEGEQVPKRWPDYISPQFFLLLNPRIPKRSRLTRNRRSHETTSRTGFEKGGGARKDPQSRYFLFQQRKIPGSSGDNGKERNRVTKNPDKGSLLRERHLENTGNRRYFREYHRRSYQKRSQLIGQRIVFPPFRFLRLILDPTVSSLCSGMIRIRLAKYPSILSTRVTVCNSRYPEYSFW